MGTPPPNPTGDPPAAWGQRGTGAAPRRCARRADLALALASRHTDTWLWRVCTCAPTHACTHTGRAPPPGYSYTHSVRVRAHTCRHAGVHAHPHMHTPVCSHPQHEHTPVVCSPPQRVLTPTACAHIMHVRARACTHACIHTPICTPTHTCTLIQHAHTPMLTHTACTHTCSHPQHKHTPVLTPVACSLSHTHICAHTHTCSHIQCAHTHTCSHPRAHTCSTHTDTRSPLDHARTWHPGTRMLTPTACTPIAHACAHLARLPRQERALTCTPPAAHRPAPAPSLSPGSGGGPAAPPALTLPVVGAGGPEEDVMVVGAEGCGQALLAEAEAVVALRPPLAKLPLAPVQLVPHPQVLAQHEAASDHVPRLQGLMHPVP